MIGIWSTFLESGMPSAPRRKAGRRDEGVKVDVVADGGKRWIRVNTCVSSVPFCLIRLSTLDADPLVLLE